MDASRCNRRGRHSGYRRVAIAAIGLVASFIWGCAPRGAHPDLLDARADYMRARSDSSVQQNAATPLHEADRILYRAEQMWERGGDSDEVRDLAYLAKSQIQAARTMAAYEQARLQLETETKAREAAAKQRGMEAQRRGKEGVPIIHSGRSWTPELDVQVRTAFDGTVDGTLINRSPNPISDIVLMVNHKWLWLNEFRPGNDSPGRTEFFRIAEQIPPGGSVNFTHRPLAPLPARNDGRFETSLEVVSFDEIRN